MAVAQALVALRGHVTGSVSKKTDCWQAQNRAANSKKRTNLACELSTRRDSEKCCDRRLRGSRKPERSTNEATCVQAI